MSWIRVVVINVVVLFGLLVVLELTWVIYDTSLRSKVKCKPDWVLYHPCPNTETTRLNHISDGGRLIKIHFDELGGRVQPGSKSTLQKAHNFLIGDSFIHADEMSYDETIYGRWNRDVENTAYGLGYSSWNPIQYLDVIERIGRADSHYYVFLMTNDTAPGDGRSVSRERRDSNPASDILRERLFYKLLSVAKRNYEFKEARTSMKETNALEIVSDKFSVRKVNDCSGLDELKGSNYTSKLGFDYLVFSKNYDCWPEFHRKAFDEFVTITKDIESYVLSNLSSKLTFVWVGAGWAHKDQNSIGRQAVNYGFSPKISVTQKGLVDAFRRRFPNADILDTEEVIAFDLAQCTKECVDKYFYPVDGHWTPYTHELILSNLKK